MSPEGGFYYDGITAIEQDSDGFIWIMMDYELYRFDGYNYKKYYPYFASLDKTKKWVFRHMTCDDSGNLYVNTDSGIYSYNRILDSFEWIHEKVVALKTDKMNNLWVWKENVWKILDISSGTLLTPTYDGKTVTYVNPVFSQHGNDLYAFIGRKIYRFNYANNEFVSCFTIPANSGTIRFARAQQGKLWVYMNRQGLYKIDLTTFRIEDHFDFIPESLRTFYVDQKGYVWYGTINGLYILDPSTREYSHYIHSDNDPFSLPNSSVWTISEDKQRNVWLGTYSGALCYVNIDEENAFETFQPANSELNHTPVSAFAEDSSYLWIGTEGGGINRVDKSTGKFTYFNDEKGITYNNIKSLVVDKNENIWIGMYLGGLDHLDTKTNSVRNFKQIANDSNSLVVNDIRKIIPEGDSGMWIAYQHYKPVISHLSLNDQTFSHLKLDSVAGNEFLFDILKQGEQYLWAISNQNLYRIDIRTHAVKKIQPADSTYMGMFTFCLDDSGNIWIGTIANGLIKFNTNTSQFIPLKENLHSDIYSIYSICYDDGNLWMGTDDGLYCYNIARNDLLKFDEREGTQGQVYYPLASMRGNDGKLYFGGTKGFTVINPGDISRNGYKPRVIISEFFIDHQSSHPQFASEDSAKTIVLNYDQINFGFKFSSDNYHIPEKNRFKYRLRGYDNRWIETDASNRTAMYSKVPAGIYYFEVIAANNDGVWSETPTIIRIERKPAPWRSLHAYILYGLIVLGIIYMSYRYYADKKNLKMQLYLENIEKDKKEQIHQAQLRFFTNISHDFRTPLSLIIAALDKLRREGLKEYYYRILNGNTQRLLNLVNELMDFRTVENGKMKLALQSVNLNNFIKETAYDFLDYAKQRNITFRIMVDSDIPAEVYIDKNIVEKVTMNLLNNAFKYTPDNGTVTIETRLGNMPFVSKFKSNYTIGGLVGVSDSIFIVVSDTGVGISQESIRSVFERFYKVNTVNTDSHLGTGIGLALVKSLVLLHKGYITIYSERNKGTDMVVCLPLDPSLFNESDYLKKEQPELDTAPQSINTTLSDLEEAENIWLSNKKKILIAEDNEDLRRLIAEFLSDEFEVIQAADGRQASELIGEISFDLIVSDIMMPYKDGISLCAEIKEDINTSHISVILLTAKTSMESKMEGVITGADVYLEKPVDFDYLKLTIQNIFRNQQQLKEYYARNYYADSSELSTNEQDNKFLKKLTTFIEQHLDESEMDVNLIATELSMSRSKLYTKVKSLTGKSVVEFVLNYRLRKAAKLIIEENINMKEVMAQIGIESQPYFTNSFKKMFGETPTAFAARYKTKDKNK